LNGTHLNGKIAHGFDYGVRASLQSKGLAI